MATGCLDSNENEVDCGDADCSYGPCGAVTTQNSQTGNAACLDAAQNPVVCSDPTCALGDCIDTLSGKGASSLGAAAAATQGGGGAAPSTSPLGIFSSLSTAAVTAFAATQGTTIKPPTTVANPGLSLGGNTGILLLVVAAIAFFAFGGAKKLSAA
jgi:hypothetical protein